MSTSGRKRISDSDGRVYYQSKSNSLVSVENTGEIISEDPQHIYYNFLNKPDSITEGNLSYSLIYGGDNQRIKAMLTDSGELSKTTYYGPGYEKIITPDSTFENHYIASPYGLEAIIVKKNNTERLYYAETDHLGSLIGLISSTGTYAERHSYDSWGRRRNPTDWSYNNVPEVVITERGFTGHEHLDMFGLINMNGRMYDPVTGRFLNVDPVIQDPSDSQNFNSYSYCLNNPLKYIDPSGYKRCNTPDDRTVITLWDHIVNWFKTRGNRSSHSDSGEGNDSEPDGPSPFPPQWVDDGVSNDPPDVYLIGYSTPGGGGTSATGNNFFDESSIGATLIQQISGIITNNPYGQDDPNRYVRFTNLKEAELYINRNAKASRKEIFFYITITGDVIVGPWSDAKVDRVSPRYLEIFNEENRSVYFERKYYQVEFFVHTHFLSKDPSGIDKMGFKYFNFFGILPLIYFEGNYFYYDSTGVKSIIYP